MLNIKVKHFGQDYSAIKVGRLEFESPLGLGEALLKETSFKKIVSLNPKRYINLSFDKAMTQYDEYLDHWFESVDTNAIFKSDRFKSFKDWLKTEI